MDRTTHRTAWFGGIFLLLLAKLVLLRFFLFDRIMWESVLTDAVSVLIMVSFLELVVPAKRKKAAYIILNVIVSFILFASAIYHVHFGSIPTYTALSGLGQVNQVRGSIASLIEPAHFLFFADLGIAAIWWICLRIRRRQTSGRNHFEVSQPDFRSKGPKKYGWKISMSVLLASGLLISFFFVRQGSGIENELARAEKIGFFNYQVAAAIRSSQENRVLAAGNLEDTAKQIHKLQKTYSYQKDSDKKPQLFGAAEGMNLIVVQMESLQRFPLHQSIDGQVITPVMNSLAEEGIYFPNVFQQIGQGNTSDAEFISNTSIYPVGTEAMSTGFGSRSIPSLPKILKSKGYVSSTFHVNDITFWDRNQMYPALGFDQYYEKASFKDDKFNAFGASDEELYRKGVEEAKKLQEENKTFYFQFVTVSNHSPFIVPADRSKINIPENLKGTQLGRYLENVNYSDYALGQLIASLKQNGLWDNTVLVVYGDHFGVNSNETDASLIESTLNTPYHEQISRFNIPFIIRVPGMEKGMVVEQTGGQVDMLPTIANIMGISLEDEHFTAMGQDLLNIDNNIVGMRYYLPTGSFFNDEVLFIPGTGFEDGQAVSLKTLEPVADISPYREDYEYILKLMKLSDEYVKLLPKRSP